METRHPV